MSSKTFGVYFIANDHVYSLAKTFLSSFRRFNPDLPLCLIPYDSRSKKIRALSQKYGFGIFDPTDLLQRCDQISRLYHDKVYGHYRKLAPWEGPFEQFIYIDIDTVVQHSFDFVFSYLKDYDYIAASAHDLSTLSWVWKNTICSRAAPPVLTWEQKSFAANTGFFCSRRGLLNLNTAQTKAMEALKLKPYMELTCIEQPLLNYIVVTSFSRYTSLFKIATQTQDYRLPLERWAGIKGGLVENGSIRYTADSNLLFHENPTLFLHWVGLWQPPKMFKFFGPSRKIPYRDLWNYYRHL